MKRTEAEQIVRECIAEKYDRSKFSRLIANIFHSGLAPTTGNVTVLPAYESHVRTCTKIGTATTADNRIVPIYEVLFKGDGSVQNARRKQRDFIASLVEAGQADGALVAFVSEKKSDTAWRLSFVTVENRLVQKNGKNVSEKEKTPAKRWSFMVGGWERIHTPLSRFTSLVEPETVPQFDDIERTFDVETVTKEFFNQYKELFLRLKETMDGLFDKDEALKNHFETLGISSADFAKKTLGQIVFLYFLQKKGWFGITKNEVWGKGQKDFLRKAFVRHSNGDFGTRNFFNDVLEPLFYQGLSQDRSSSGQLYDFGNGSEYKIPYLNGGLFEPVAGYDWKHTSIPIPDDFFSNSTVRTSDGTGVLDIFDLYNFTVNEEEPLEKEVAIDPEMLGKIFENLLEVTDRKSKGAFYTPRPIVHYMCEESLIEYLKTSTKVNEEGIRSLIRQKNLKWDSESDEDFKRRPVWEQEAIRNIVRNIDQKLGEVKIFDPAIGSGAFPMGLLHEIVSIRRYFREHGWIDYKENAPKATKENYAYELKRLAIENSLYGSDIDPGAITVAKLRCWLSLLIDAEEPHPLPNLDFKFVCANTLIPLRIRDSLQSQLSTTLQEQMKIFVEFDQKRIAYFGANEARKNVLKGELKALQAKLRNLLEQGAQMDDISSEYRDEVMKFVTWDIFGNGSAPFFNQRLMYGIKDGFDIVIGNPPYVFSRSSESKGITKEQKDFFYKNFELAKYQINLYSLFLEKGNSLLRPSGVLSYIIPNNWLTINTNKDLREFILNRSNITIVNCLSKVFESANVDSAIVIFTNDKSNRIVSLCEYTDFKTIDLVSKTTPDYFLNKSDAIINIDALKNRETSLMVDKIESKGVPLKNMSDVKAGLMAYEIGKGKPAQTEEMKNKRVYHSTEAVDGSYIRYLDGRNVSRYMLSWSGEFLKYGENLAAPRKFELFSTPRILVRQIPSKLPYCIHACYVEETMLNDRNSMNIVNLQANPLYVLGILNSRLISFWFAHKFGKLSRGIFPQFKINELEQFPISRISHELQKPFISLVDQVLSIKKSNSSTDTSHLESQIDALVYQLYDLTPEEIAIIEGK